MNPLRDAAKTLPGRWYKGEYGDGNGNFCGIGHVMRAIGLSEDDIIDGNDEGRTDEYADHLNLVAGELYPDRAMVDPGTGNKFPEPFFAWFNDHEDTTEDEVVAVLEKAAVRWDEKIN